MPVFPLATVPAEGFQKSAGHNRWFGGYRKKGRIHAACDLIARRGTPVYAVDAGQIKKIRYFYEGTDEIVIRHTNFVVRYGEVERNKVPENISENQWVKPGQLIGWVGALGMLHFEMFQGTIEGYLTQEWNKKTYKYVTPGNFYRRPDLLNPTPFLDEWKPTTYTFDYEAANAAIF